LPRKKETFAAALTFSPLLFLLTINFYLDFDLIYESFQKKATVCPPESKGITQGIMNFSRPGFVGNIIQVAFRIRMLIVDCRRHNLIFQT
jgi:hypothetical protein